MLLGPGHEIREQERNQEGGGHSTTNKSICPITMNGSMMAMHEGKKGAFWRKGGGVIGVRWLLSQERRKGKAASSMVVFL